MGADTSSVDLGNPLTCYLSVDGDLMNSLLYEKESNRYLNNGELKPVTVGIAAICNVRRTPEGKITPPAIVFCADRLVSAGVQFEGRESKIKQITDYCFVIQSADDSLGADLILERLRQRVSTSQTPLKIEEIMEKLRTECVNYKKEWFENNILQKYNQVFEKFHNTPESSLNNAIREVGSTRYSKTFHFIVLGLEPSKEAHLFFVDQNGNYRLQDSLGFATIGSGGQLAFLELTKLHYSRFFQLTLALPLVFRAKRISERSEGVGRDTDLLVLVFGREETFSPKFIPVSNDQGLMKQMDGIFEAISQHEIDELAKLGGTIQTMIHERATATKKPE